jgi:hypothetical protein
VPGRKLVHALEQSLGCGRGRKRQIQGERGLVEAPLQPGVGEERLDLRSKDQRVRGRREVQRLHADAIAYQQQLPPPTIPQRERKHAAQLMDALGTELLVQVQDHLGVAVRPEPVPPGF